jgi:hypothetical protein
MNQKLNTQKNCLKLKKIRIFSRSKIININNKIIIFDLILYIEDRYLDKTSIFFNLFSI